MEPPSFFPWRSASLVKAGEGGSKPPEILAGGPSSALSSASPGVAPAGAESATRRFAPSIGSTRAATRPPSISRKQNMIRRREDDALSGEEGMSFGEAPEPRSFRERFRKGWAVPLEMGPEGRFLDQRPQPLISTAR